MLYPAIRQSLIGPPDWEQDSHVIDGRDNDRRHEFQQQKPSHRSL